MRASTFATVPELAREVPFMRLLLSGEPDVSTLDVAALQRNDNAATAFFTMQALAENRLNGLRSMRAATRDLLAALAALDLIPARREEPFIDRQSGRSR
jgi:hypothetical protein